MICPRCSFEHMNDRMKSEEYNEASGIVFVRCTNCNCGYIIETRREERSIYGKRNEDRDNNQG